MCRSPGTGGTGQTRPGGPSLGAGWRGITGQRAGAVTDAPGASGAVWPRSLRRSPPEQARLRENGETTFGAVDRGPVRAANNGKPGRSRGRPPGTTSRPKRRSRDRWCGRTLCDGRHVCPARNGAARSRWVPAPIPGSVLLCLTHPRTRFQSAGGANSTRGRLLILILCSSRMIRFWGRESERDGPEENRAGAEAGGGRTQGVQAGYQRRAAWRVGRHRHWKRVLGRCRCNDGFFGCWAGRNEASGEPVIVRIQNGR